MADKEEGKEEKCPVCGAKLFSGEHDMNKCRERMAELVVGQPGRIIWVPVDKKQE